MRRIIIYRNKKRSSARSKRLVLKAVATLAVVVLTYQAGVYTVPIISEKLKTVAVVSAGISFIDGGVVLAKRQLAEFQAEDSDFYTKHAAGEDNLSDTISQNTGENQDSTQDSSKDTQAKVETKNPASTDPAASTPNTTPPQRPEAYGEVVRKTLTPGSAENFVQLSSGSVKNLSYLTNDEVKMLSEQPLAFALDDKQTRKTSPQVLIYHTHATESYQPYSVDWYDPAYSARNTDNSQNMVAVGDVLTQRLQEAGINTIHDVTQHDNPSYTGAYDRSRVTIQRYLEEYPSIKVILDIHRDALQGDNVITAPVTEIDGKPTAQLMIISCADDGSEELPNFRQNLTFAGQLQRDMESKYETLTRSILLDERTYNQDISPGALLVEVGGHGNTLEEAKNAIELFAKSLISVLG